MQRHRVGPHHFTGSTGYGHGDLGREAFDQVLVISISKSDLLVICISAVSSGDSCGSLQSFALLRVVHLFQQTAHHSQLDSAAPCMHTTYACCFSQGFDHLACGLSITLS